MKRAFFLGVHKAIGSVMVAAFACAVTVSADLSAPGVGLEDLFNLEVTSVTKTAQRLEDVATSIYVVSAQDIRRSGATRLQDILRLVPGVWIADQSYEAPSFAIRESANLFQQSVNVLVDGVPVTSPVTGGLYFLGFQLPIHEIERVEVIKGPGGTIYGANSATGIVNIVTYSAEESRGLRFSLDGASRDYLAPSLRYGHRFSDKVSASGFFRFRNHAGYRKNSRFANDSIKVTGTSLLDGSETVFMRENRFVSQTEGAHRGFVGGGDATVQPSPAVKIKLTGWGQVDNGLEYTSAATRWDDSPDLSSLLQFATTGRTPNNDSVWLEQTVNNSAVLSARTDINFSPDHKGFAHAYVSRNRQLFGSASGGAVGVAWTTVEGEVQDNLELLKDRFVGLGLIGGASARAYILDTSLVKRYEDVAYTSFTNSDPSEYVVAGFLLGTVSIGDPLDITIGVKAETWTLIAIRPQFSPSLRVRLRPRDNVMFWGALSRSVTTPGYLQTSIESRQTAVPPAQVLELQFGPQGVPVGAGKWVAAVNASSIRPATYLTGELGGRTSIIPGVFLDLSTYYSRYEDKIDVTGKGFEILDSVIVSRVNGDTIVPLYYRNQSAGELFGGEAVMTIRPAAFIEAEVSYAYFGKKARGSGDSSTEEKKVFSTPSHVGRLGTTLLFPHDYSLTLHALVHSVYEDVSEYDYVNQKFSITNLGSTQQVDPSVRLDLLLEKLLLEGNMRLALWGKNLLVSEKIESYGPYLLTYPHTVHRTFGASVSFSF